MIVIDSRSEWHGYTVVVVESQDWLRENDCEEQEEGAGGAEPSLWLLMLLRTACRGVRSVQATLSILLVYVTEDCGWWVLARGA